MIGNMICQIMCFLPKSDDCISDSQNARTSWVDVVVPHMVEKTVNTQSKLTGRVGHNADF